jgi:hypothetical protein
MDPIMQALFGRLPISQLPSVQAAAAQKNNNNTILFMGALVLVGGILVYNIYRENQYLKNQLKLIKIKPRE